MYDRTGYFEAEPNHRTFGNLPNRSAEGSAEPFIIKKSTEKQKLQLLLTIEFIATFLILIELKCCTKNTSQKLFSEKKNIFVLEN